MMNAPLIRIENLSKSYLEGNQVRTVLKDLTLEIPSAEFIAVIGKSGSGKSTLLNLISGIDKPDQGEIWFNDQDLTTLSEYDRTLFRRENIGFIFQFFNLLPTLTVGENITLPLELNGFDPGRARDLAKPLIAEVGLADRWNTFPDRLSGGEQQRVAIARALVHDPLIILADEPTGNLDEETGRQIITLLNRLTREAGKNMIMVTHSLEVAKSADRIFQLREGNLEVATLQQSKHPPESKQEVKIN